MRFGREPVEVELPGGEVFRLKATSKAQGILTQVLAGQTMTIPDAAGLAMERFDEILLSGVVVDWRNVPGDPTLGEILDALDFDEKMLILITLLPLSFATAKVDAAVEAGAADPTETPPEPT